MAIKIYSPRVDILARRVCDLEHYSNLLLPSSLHLFIMLDYRSALIISLLLAHAALCILYGGIGGPLTASIYFCLLPLPLSHAFHHVYPPRRLVGRSPDTRLSTLEISNSRAPSMPKVQSLEGRRCREEQEQHHSSDARLAHTDPRAAPSIAIESSAKKSSSVEQLHPLRAVSQTAFSQIPQTAGCFFRALWAPPHRSLVVHRVEPPTARLAKGRGHFPSKLGETERRLRAR